MTVAAKPPAVDSVVGGDGAGVESAACADFSRDGWRGSLQCIKMDELESGVCKFGDDGVFSELNG